MDYKDFILQERRAKHRIFQEIMILKDSEENFIIHVYYLSESRTLKNINYNVKNKKIWVIKKDGIAYNIFREKLESLYCKPISKEIMNISEVF